MRPVSSDLREDESGTLFYGSVRISSKGQIVIPQRVREAFDLQAGDQLLVIGRPEQHGFGLIKPEAFVQIQREFARMQAQLSLLGTGGPDSSGHDDQPVDDTPAGRD